MVDSSTVTAINSTIFFADGSEINTIIRNFVEMIQHFLYVLLYFQSPQRLLIKEKL